MATGRDLVRQALKKAGVLGQGRAPSAEDLSDGLEDLNDMIGQWATDRLMVWVLDTYNITSTGALTYSVGPGGDFNINPRPDRIESAFARQTTNAAQPIDYPLDIIPSLEEFNLLALKSLVSFPKYAYYQSSWPLGSIRSYPVMNASLYQLFISVKNVLQVFTASTVLAMPRQYSAAIKFCLAQRLRQAYGKGMKPDPALDKLAAQSLRYIKNANIQVPELQQPKVLQRPGLYNILSDQNY